MTELDPYAVLGVPRAATRAEIARAYRALAKRHHPDAGAPPSPRMARVNEAWRILSDPSRRARWDEAHGIVVPPHWAARPETRRRPPPAPPPSESARDSGWLAVAVVGAAAAILVGLLVLIGLSSGPTQEADDSVFTSIELRIAHPDDWRAFPGEDEGLDHRVVAHVVTFGIGRSERCTSFDAPCLLAVPPGEASIVITAWGAGTPPVPDPVVRRSYGLDADRIIGGAPAAFSLERTRDAATAWWQLSPPGFPDQWIEVNAEIGGPAREQEAVLQEIEAALATLQFGP